MGYPEIMVTTSTKKFDFEIDTIKKVICGGGGGGLGGGKIPTKNHASQNTRKKFLEAKTEENYSCRKKFTLQGKKKCQKIII